MFAPARDDVARRVQLSLSSTLHSSISRISHRTLTIRSVFTQAHLSQMRYTLAYSNAPSESIDITQGRPIK